MPTNAISAYQNNGISSFWKKTNQTEEEQAAASSSSDSKRGNLKSRIREQINSILADVPKGADGKLSFQDVDDYRKKLETDWDEQVKADLKKLGVDVTKELPLQWDAAKNAITVSSSHPDKKIIDKYFESTEDRVDEFKKIIQLGKLTSTARNNFTPAEIRRDIQSRSMEIWFENNTDPASWFKGGGKMVGQGQSNYTGLNLKV